MTSADDIRDFYNQTFFPAGKVSEAEIDLTIRSGRTSIRIHNIVVGPSASLDTIIRSYHKFLKENGPVDAEAEPAPDNDRLIDFDQVVYKNRNYLIEERPGDVFIVRKATGDILNELSPTTKAIIKQFKEAKEKLRQ